MNPCAVGVPLGSSLALPVFLGWGQVGLDSWTLNRAAAVQERDDQSQTAEAEQQHRQLGEGRSQSQARLPRREEEARRPRFAPEFDGIDCFETIVWR